MTAPARCPRCLFAYCLCADIPQVTCRTGIVIVRHHTERFRTSNSGRLVHLAVAGSRLHDLYGAGAAPLLEPAPGTWLVYPEGAPRVTPPDPAPSALVFLDASWAQARRMRRRLQALRGLPVLCLAPRPAAVRMRRAPGAARVSTLEAVASALRLLEGDQPAAPLERLFATAIDRLRRAGRELPDGDPASTGRDSSATHHG